MVAVPSEVEPLMRQRCDRLTRRSLLAGTVVLGLGAVVGACGGAASEPSSLAAPASAAQPAASVSPAVTVQPASTTARVVDIPQPPPYEPENRQSVLDRYKADATRAAAVLNSGKPVLLVTDAIW